MFLFRRLVLLPWLLLPALVSSSQTIDNLYFNSTTDIIRLNFSGNAPQIHYTGIASGASIGEGIAHAEDAEGNIIIWVNASGAYDKNGALMPGSTGIKAHPSSNEIVICPFPQDPTKFYLFYNNQLCSSLYYSVVDLTLRKGLGDVTILNTPLDAANRYAEGLEIVKVPCSPNYWLLAYQCYTGFKRFRISASGIESGTLLHSFNADNHQGRGELDYHHGRMGYAATYRNRAFVADFDALTGSLSHPKELSLPATNGVYGLEFSPDASKVYFTDWNNRDFFGNIASPNLFRFDFTDGVIASWTIPYSTGNCPQAVVEGLGQLELGRDGRLYSPQVGGCQIMVVENPNASTPAFRTLDVNTILSSGVSDPIQSQVSEPALRAQAEKSSICAGEAVKLTASGGSGQYSWQPAAGLTHPDAGITEGHPSVTTTYTLYSTNPTGCRDSTLVTVAVSSPPQPVIDIIGNRPQCGNTAATLQATKGLSEKVWLVDGHPIASASADSILITQPGIYQVRGMSNGCAVSSEPVTIDPSFFDTPAELFVPNVFTPNHDPESANESFVIKRFTGTIKLVILNRWGKEVFRSEDYQNDWTAEGISAGVYFYFLTQENNCFPPQRGWVQVLR